MASYSSPSPSSSTPLVWSDRARIPRKRNRSTSATITNLSSNNTRSLGENTDPLQGTSADSLHSMTRHEQRTHTNDYSLSPSKQIFQHFSSWSGLTNSDVSPSSDPQPPKKRRKGVAGAILSTALEAALFTSAIGYAAYNFWCGKGLEEEEATRLLPKARFSRSMPNQSLLSSPPPPPYEPPEQMMEPILMARAPRKPTSTRSATAHRVYSSHPIQPSSIPSSDSINFILRPNPTPSINHSFHLKDESASIELSSSSYIYHPPSEPTNSNELDDEEYEEDDEELKAFKAQIQGLIKEGREALASRPSIPNSITHSSSSSSLRPPPLSSKIINKSRQTTTNTHLQPIVTSTDKSTQSVAQLDENVQLLQIALEKAALPSHSNWWER